MSDKTIVFITGANSGIGFDTVAAFAASPSYHVIIGSRSIPNGEQALKDLQARKLPGTLSFQQIDISDDKSIAAAADAIGKEYGRVDYLINNAGVASRGKTFRERLQEDLNTNAIGSALVTETFEPLVLKSTNPTPRIIYISSIMGSISLRADENSPFFAEGYSSYRASKSALNMLALCDHARLKDKGIKVTMVCPGYVQSNLDGKNEEARRKREERGAGSSEVSAQTILSVAEGKREESAGAYVNKEGTISW